MAFTGDLEHLPIVDVIQLLNTTRKSGALTVRSEKGASKLIFSEGHIVSANHLNSSVCIGSVLRKMGVVSAEDLELALEAQESAGDSRKPLIGTLVEMGKVKQEDAHNGLKKLVQLVVVELVGWTVGTFTLETEAISVSDQCSYEPANMEQDIFLDAQMVLMDALRIFDEKQRDGTSKELIFTDEELASGEVEEVLPRAEGPSQEKPALPSEVGEITADDLGLDDLDKLEKKIPDVFRSIKIVDPSEIHRQRVNAALGAFSLEEREQFVSFLMKYSEASPAAAVRENQAWGVVLFSSDELVAHSIMTICKYEGALVFSTSEEEDLDPIIDQYVLKKIVPVLIFDEPDISDSRQSHENVTRIRQQKKEKYPQLSVIQLASETDYRFILQSYNDGVKAVFPKPTKEISNDTFVEDNMRFFETLLSYTKSFFSEQDQQMHRSLKDSVLELQELSDAPDISFAMLSFVSERFERSLTFIVRDGELMAERGIGVKGDKSDGVSSPMKFSLTLSKPSVFSVAVERGEVFYGECEDEVLKGSLFKEIGDAKNSTILLLPMKRRGKTIALTYADFGQKEPALVQLDELVIFASQAGLVLENSQYRRQLEKSS
ncbi:MAG: DUF4388 domain-containing protein [bacterium]|nr:DUF4388 domain-containing protein [bacterium]